MPILQLNAPRAAELGRPVLDNVRRPEVNLGGVERGIARLAASTRMVQMPEELARNGYGAIGAAVMKAGSILGALGEKRLEAEEDLQVSKGHLAMKQAWAQQEIYMRENPTNPAAWTQHWNDNVLPSVRKSVLGAKDLHPGARRTLELLANQFQGERGIDVEVARSKQTFAQAGDMVRATVQTQRNERNWPAAENALNGAVEKGYMSHEERANELGSMAKERERLAKQDKIDAANAEQDLILRGLDSGPDQLYSYAEALESKDARERFPNLETDDLMRLRGIAAQKKAQLRNDALRDIRDGVVSGAFREDSIELAAGEARLGAEDRLELQQFRKDFQQSQMKPGVDWQQVANLRARIRAFDAEALGGVEKAGPVWEGLMREAELIGASEHDAEKQTSGALKSMLYNHHPLLKHKKPAGRASTVLLDKLLNSYEKDEAFGKLEVRQKVTQKDMVDGKEKDVTKFVDAPNTAAVRAALTARSEVAKSFQKAVELGTIKDPEDAVEVGAWLAGQLKHVKAGEAVNALMQSFQQAEPPGWTGASAALFPEGSLRDLDAKMDKVLPAPTQQTTVADPFATGELPRGENPLNRILGPGGMDESLINKLLK